MMSDTSHLNSVESDSRHASAYFTTRLIRRAVCSQFSSKYIPNDAAQKNCRSNDLYLLFFRKIHFKAQIKVENAFKATLKESLRYLISVSVQRSCVIGLEQILWIIELGKRIRIIKVIVYALFI